MACYWQEDIREIRQDLKEHKVEMRNLVDNRFYWTIGLMLTLLTMQGGLVVSFL